MGMYNVPTNNCNIEIMGYPFFAEKVSANEAFNRRDIIYNNLVGGTAIVTPGAYIPIEFTITTHVFVNEDRPDEHNMIFQEMMSKPVEVVSPEIGGILMAMVTIKPEHAKNNTLELSITIKEIPELNSNIPGESWVVPAAKDVEVNGKKGTTTPTTSASSTATTSQTLTLESARSKLHGTPKSATSAKENPALLTKYQSIAKKNKGES